MRTILTALSFLLLLPTLPATALAGETREKTSLGTAQEKPVRYYRYRKIRRIRRYPTRVRPVRQPRRQASVDPRSSIYLGVGLIGDFNVETENELTSIMRSGGGIDLFLGLRFNRFFALEFGYVGTMQSTGEFGELENNNNTYDRGLLHGVALDAKIFLMPKSRHIEPFLQVGGGGYSFVRQGAYDPELGGGGFHLGGGVDIRLNRSIALGGRILYKGIYLDNSTEWYPATEAALFNQITLGANLQLHF